MFPPPADLSNNPTNLIFVPDSSYQCQTNASTRHAIPSLFHTPRGGFLTIFQLISRNGEYKRQPTSLSTLILFHEKFTKIFAFHLRVSNLEDTQKYATQVIMEQQGRRHNRFRDWLEVVIHLENDDDEFYEAQVTWEVGMTLNISRGGIFVNTTKPPDEHATLEMSLLLPPHRQEVKVIGRVAHVVDEAEAQEYSVAPGCGIEFLRFDNLEHLESCYHYVERVSQVSNLASYMGED